MDCSSAEIFLDGKPASFELDTGASVTVVGERMAKAKKLKPATKTLRRPIETPLNVLGVFTATISHKGTAIGEMISVLAQWPTQPFCLHKTGLIARIDSISTPNFKQEFPQIFRGLGNSRRNIQSSSKTTPLPLCVHQPNDAKRYDYHLVYTFPLVFSYISINSHRPWSCSSVHVL